MGAEDEPTSLPSPESQKAASPVRTQLLRYSKETESEAKASPAIVWDMTPSASVRTTPVPRSVSRSETPRPSRSSAPPTSNFAAPPNHICLYPQCVGRTFARACEWKKHNQRHTRPFRCSHPSCNVPGKEMKGFTYAGGLVRHEKEVHGQHGGTKEIWHCPYNTCKRHLGEGFKRQDNLKEHVKRMHTSEGQEDSGHDEGRHFKDEYYEDESEEGEICEDRRIDTIRTLNRPPRATSDPAISRKRKWSTASLASDYTVSRSYNPKPTPVPATPGEAEMGASDTAELVSEVKRLRHINLAKDAEIARLEQIVLSLQGAIHSLTGPAGVRTG